MAMYVAVVAVLLTRNRSKGVFWAWPRAPHPPDKFIYTPVVGLRFIIRKPPGEKNHNSRRNDSNNGKRKSDGLQKFKESKEEN